MESAVQLPRYVVFDLSAGAGLRCFSAAPAVEHVGVPFRTQTLGLETLHRTRLSRADDLAAHRPIEQAGTAMNSCDRVQISDPDTVSDAGTSGVQAAEESEDEADSFDELFFQEGFARKIDALAQLVGMEGAYKPAAVLGEVVRVLQAADRRKCSLRANTAV
ncbi:hypothetical protein SETIT_5G269300v2 [Setaria italica]|uniref:Uncharacterized protein n=1 Tax=Setaria italica TaxID=4555 RepID=K3XMQ1_SETIT|nr:uncharacterized protein LOC101757336 [Setaria italica]RCV26722.1 hypothetical protein SETIT_5G269300v2 [Setaria italica]